MQEDKISELAACRVLAEQAYVDRKVVLNEKTQIARLRALGVEIRSQPEYYETFTLLAVRAKTRGAAANSHMSVLRRMRERAGEIEKYWDFEKLIAEHSGGIQFGGHGYRERSLEDANETEVFTGIAGLLNALEELGHKAFVNSGTLLGLVRDKKLIPYDDDIDLAVVLKSRGEDEAAHEFRALAGKLNEKGIECYLYPGSTAIIKLPNLDGFEVDLFPAYGSKRRFSIYPYAPRSLKYTDVFPLKTCEISGLPIPARATTLLEQNYGKSWEVPDPRFVFNWPRQKRKFARLIREVAA